MVGIPLGFLPLLKEGDSYGSRDYGLLPLGRLPDDWDGDAEDRDLSRPFPLTGAWLWEEDEDAPDRIDDGSEDHGARTERARTRTNASSGSTTTDRSCWAPTGVR